MNHIGTGHARNPHPCAPPRKRRERRETGGGRRLDAVYAIFGFAGADTSYFRLRGCGHERTGLNRDDSRRAAFADRAFARRKRKGGKRRGLFKKEDSFKKEVFKKEDETGGGGRGGGGAAESTPAASIPRVADEILGGGGGGGAAESTPAAAPPPPPLSFLPTFIFIFKSLGEGAPGCVSPLPHYAPQTGERALGARQIMYTHLSVDDPPRTSGWQTS
ncbi:hypothetical protein T492DRAFT_838437 [Pavlovales sp. CCMP2436]|nr:hypothetical protein T492DRAFT_838437 [Pavlovales sp. CCMP2436]